MRFLGQLAGLAASLALAGCCANNSCNCRDELADALFFRINYTTRRQLAPNGDTLSFDASDIDTLRLYRTNRRPVGNSAAGFVQQTDVVTIVRPLISGGTELRSDIIVINNAAPFAGTGSTKLTGYDYRIAVVSRRPGRRNPLTTYRISNPQLQGRFSGVGCCTCYENTGKSYTLTTRLPNGTLDSVRVNAADTLNRVVRLRYAR